MTYLGWMIFAYRYYHDKPFLQAPVAKTDLVKAVRNSFQEADWSISDEKGQILLTKMPTQSEVKVEVHGWDIAVEYDDGSEEETYLVALILSQFDDSQCLTNFVSIVTKDSSKKGTVAGEMLVSPLAATCGGRRAILGAVLGSAAAFAVSLCICPVGQLVLAG
jgi:hypothetical protein